MAFIGEVEKCLVPFYRTTECAAKLIVSKCSVRIGLWVEYVASIELVVSEKLEQRAVKIVGARLCDDVDDCARVATILRFKIREYRSFLDSFDW